MKKRLIILGSTGSIGTRALDVVRDFPDLLEVVALATNQQTDLLQRQVDEFHPEAICVGCCTRDEHAREIAVDGQLRLFQGNDGLVDMINQIDADIILTATVGFVGLAPTLAAIDRGMTIALANKEVLVTAGDLVMEAARRKGVKILPVDSEHNAIYQCLEGCNTKDVNKLILTASGGPFREWGHERLATVTPEDALQHPTWNMGRKITIDSSTLMNKGFEVIEAAHLFDVPIDQVDVVVHPQSTVHSMVEFVDGSIIAQLGTTDMYLPIQNVLLYPDRKPNPVPRLDLAAVGQLTFFPPDMDRFPCLRYAYEASRSGGTMPAVLNGANEVAVERFLAGDLSYCGIAQAIENAMNSHSQSKGESLEEIQEADSWARSVARQFAR